MQNKFNQSPEEFLATPRASTWRGDQFIRINISRNTLIAFIGSILFHALILLMVLPKLKEDAISPVKSSPIQITLAQPKKAEVVIETPQEVQPETTPVLPAKPMVKPPKKTKVITQKPQVQNPPPVFSVPKELALKPPAPEVPPTKPAQQEAPTDMMSYIKSKRAERLATGDAAEQNAAAVASEAGPSEEEKRNERIKSNMKSGTNGIFEITSLGSRSATFAFRGWTGDYSNAKLQYFEVEAKSGQDIRLNLIRRMIALIREHYQGDFNWESHRLGRVISLSARPEDSGGLEDFMMTEFFGVNYKNL